MADVARWAMYMLPLMMRLRKNDEPMATVLLATTLPAVVTVSAVACEPVLKTMLSDVPVPLVLSSVSVEDAPVPPIISGEATDVAKVGLATVSRVPLVVIVPPVRLPVVATEVTVPPPLPAGVAHVPSPLQKVVEEAPVPLFKLVTGKLLKPETAVPEAA